MALFGPLAFSLVLQNAVRGNATCFGATEGEARATIEVLTESPR